MVDLKINLLVKKRGISQELEKKERRAYVGSLIFFVVVLVALAGIYGWQFFSTRELENVEDEISSVEREVQGLQEASLQQLYLKSRIGIVGGFLNSKVSSREALQRVFSINIANAVVQEASFEQEDMIGLSFKADNALVLSNIFEYFKNDDYFAQVVNDGISKSEDGNYTISLKLYLNKEGV